MLRLLVTLLLLFFAGVLLVAPETAVELTGRAPLADLDPASLDRDLPRADRAEGARRLADRNLVRVEIQRDTTVGELLDLYGLDHPHVRRALALQEGRPTLDDDHRLEAGSVYRLYLVPPEP